MSIIQTTDPSRIFDRKALQGQGELLERGREVVDLIDRRIEDTRATDWKPGTEPQRVGRGMLMDYDPTPGRVNAQFADQDVSTSVHLDYDPASGAPRAFHQSRREGWSQREECLMQVDGQGLQTYEYAGVDGKGMRIVLDSKRDVLTIMEGEALPYRAPGSDTPDSSPISRAELSQQLAFFQLPIDSETHHAYRNQSWMVPVMEGFVRELGAALGTEGTISPQGLLLQSQLTLNDFDASKYGQAPKELNLFGGVKNARPVVFQQLYPMLKNVLPTGFAESFRQAYCDFEDGKR